MFVGASVVVPFTAVTRLYHLWISSASDIATLPLQPSSLADLVDRHRSSGEYNDGYNTT